MTDSPPSPNPATGPDRAPAPLLVAASLVGVEAVLLVLYGFAEISAVTGNRVAMGVTTSMFFIVYGAALAFFGWRVARLESWARSPLVLAQLIQLGVAWSFRGGAGTAAAVGLALVAVLVLAGIFHPASMEALSDE